MPAVLQCGPRQKCFLFNFLFYLLGPTGCSILQRNDFSTHVLGRNTIRHPTNSVDFPGHHGHFCC
jgi:hypothetical protein